MKSIKLFYTGSKEALNNVPIIDELSSNLVESFTTITTDDLQKECGRLMKCNTLVTLPDWEKHETSVKLVEIARMVGIVVLSHISIKSHIQNVNSENNNRRD